MTEPAVIAAIRHIGETPSDEAVSHGDADGLKAVPGKFREFLPIMSAEAATRVPDHQPWDHTIELKEGAKPTWGPLYPLSERELNVLRPWLEKNLQAGRIRRSTSSAGSPLLFAEKKDPLDPLRPFIDYRDLNSKSVPVRCPIPLITKFQDRLRKAYWMTKIDLKTGFNLIRM